MTDLQSAAAQREKALRQGCKHGPCISCQRAKFSKSYKRHLQYHHNRVRELGPQGIFDHSPICSYFAPLWPDEEARSDWF